MKETIKTPALRNAYGAFETGEMSLAAEHLALVDPKDLPKEDQRHYYFTLLAVAMHGRGDLALARAANKRLNPKFHSAMRYRYSLRAGDIATAKRIRKAGPYSDRITQDFYFSASLSCLWAGKLRSGLRLYKHRHAAQNFGRFLPKGAVYQPYEGSGTELQDVFLEQGVGDILLHLAVMREVSQHKTFRFVGDIRMAPFVDRYFPGSTLQPWGRTYPSLEGVPMHGSGDYLAAAYLSQGKFPVRPFQDATPAPFPIYGVCWRGGSAQNRREERRFALDHFLDLLPQGFTYTPLQFDITKSEVAKLEADGRFALPSFDIRSNTGALFDHIASLAGVVALDSANWHMAGLADVPIYGLMNRRTHWYWGKDAQIASVYPKAKTVGKDAVRRADLSDWLAAQKAPFLARTRPNRTDPPAADRPILITGFPRSGTSMVTGLLATCDLWMGPTIKPNGDNAKGFFENRPLRDQIVKPDLVALGCDPNGTVKLPRPEALPHDPTLRTRVHAMIAEQGYDGARMWGYKEPKLSILWPRWTQAFPDAHWVIVDRDEEGVIASCLNTWFMRETSIDPEFWRTLIARYQERLDLLEQTLPRVTRISSDAVAAGDIDPIRNLAETLDLPWKEDRIQGFVDKKLFGRHSAA